MTDAKGNPVADSTKATAASENMKPGEGAWANYDFVPGERVLLAEDFSKDRVGNFPKRFELTDGNMEIVEWQESGWPAWARRASSRSVTGDTAGRFTVEFDLTIPWGGMAICGHPHASGAAGEGAPNSVVVVSAGWPASIADRTSGESTVDPATSSRASTISTPSPVSVNRTACVFRATANT